MSSAAPARRSARISAWASQTGVPGALARRWTDLNATAPTTLLVHAHAELAALDSLYHSLAPGLLRWLRARVADPEVATDLLAETFAQVVCSVDRYRGDTRSDSAVAWVWGIARNLLRRYYRRQRVETAARQRLGVTTPAAVASGPDEAHPAAVGAELPRRARRAPGAHPRIRLAARRRRPPLRGDRQPAGVLDHRGAAAGSARHATAGHDDGGNDMTDRSDDGGVALAVDTVWHQLQPALRAALRRTDRRRPAARATLRTAPDPPGRGLRAGARRRRAHRHHPSRPRAARRPGAAVRAGGHRGCRRGHAGRPAPAARRRQCPVGGPRRRRRPLRR